MSELKEHARGKWDLIISTLLGEEFIEKRRHQACPTGQGTDCFRYSDKHGNGNFFCKCSDGTGDGFELLQCVKGWDFATAASEVEKVIGKPDGPPPEKPKPHWIFEFFRQAHASDRSRYLESRGVCPVWPLRFHRAVPYYHEGDLLGEYPAMLAPIYHGKRMRGVHVTYLNGNVKADVPVPRKVYSHLSVKHGYIPLHGSPVGDTIAVAEGIETALSVHQLIPDECPCWSCLNTSLLENFTPPSHVRRVVVAGDNDLSFAGHAAAYGLAKRMRAKGLEVEVVFPEHPGTDFNDVLIKAGRIAA
jgi:putative DNA primase/helicase